MNRETKKLEYNLSSTAYAREPREDHSKDKMMVGYPDGRIIDSTVSSIEHFLEPGDTIVFNDSKTINGIVHGINEYFGKIKFHIISFTEDDLVCSIAIRDDLKEAILEKKFMISEKLYFTIISREEKSFYRVQSNLDTVDLLNELSIVGQPIVSNYVVGDLKLKDYQNLVSYTAGSLENPVASSHLTTELLDKLEQYGINVAFITLHCVSNSAYISEDNYTEYEVPTEWFSVPEETISLIKKTKKEKNKVISIGTTVTRTLESLEYNEDYSVKSKPTGYTSLGIFPGFEFQVVDAILTNFHGSRSSRLGLAAAFIGQNEIINLYSESIKKNYKFFEFGDCTLLFNKD